MSIVPESFFITGAERSEFERVNENLHNSIYRPNFSQFIALTDKAKAQRDGERADAICADQDGDAMLASACRRRVAEIEEVLDTWRARWRECAAEERRSSHAEYEMESRAENAWLVHSERYDPEAQADLALHDALMEAR